MHKLRYFLVLTLAIPVACLKTPSAPEPQEATSITLSPPGYTFTAVGQHVQINATVLDQNSRVIVDATVYWSSSDWKIVQVSKSGLATSISAGTAQITATSGNVSASATVVVKQEVASITITPASVTLESLGETVQLEAVVYSADGVAIPDAPVEWSTGDRAIATVDARGLVTAVSNGRTRITAASGSISKYAEIRVDTESLSSSTDRAVLSAFYDATGGTGWTNNTNWLSDAPLREWYGMTTDTERRVTSLRLVENNLSGSIPPEVGQLSELAELDLERNRLTGGIPAELGQLSDLGVVSLGYNELDGELPLELRRLRNLTQFLVSHNQLSGGISSALERLTSLEVLDISSNRFAGSIPNGFTGFSSLKTLDLSHNQLTGWIPGGLGTLEDLETLSLSHNQLTGRISSFLFQEEQNNLKVVLLSNNQLTGAIPSSLGRMESIERIHLQNNQLEGRVPSDLGKLSTLTELVLNNNPDLAGPLPLSLTRLNLEYLSLSDTQLCTPPVAEFRTWLERIPRKDGLTDCLSTADREALAAFYHATGGSDWTISFNWLSYAPLEDWYGVGTDNLDRVTSLKLDHNGLAGVLSPELGKLERLTEIDLGGNRITGSIPPELGKLERLEELSLSGNELTGNIPPEIGDLVKLTRLSLTNNELSGAIPVEITRLRNLTTLAIDGNKLTGTIPPEIGRMAKVDRIELAGNELTGSIPPEFGDLDNLTHLGLGSNQLSGQIPPELGQLEKLEWLSLHSTDLTGPVPPEFGGLTSLRVLNLENNPSLAGSLPLELINTPINHFWVRNTKLCAPMHEAFRMWLEGIEFHDVTPCDPAADQDSPEQ